MLTGKSAAAAASGALSCPKTCAHLLYPGEQSRRERNRLPAPGLPREAAHGVTPSSAAGWLDLCNSSRCALDATAQTVLSSQTATAFSQAATLYLYRGPSLPLAWTFNTPSLAKLTPVRTGLSLFYRWETGVERLWYEFAVGVGIARLTEHGLQQQSPAFTTRLKSHQEDFLVFSPLPLLKPDTDRRSTWRQSGEDGQ